jgi:Ni/Fe-hydrogenase subunit HybB-like protein
VDETRLTVAMYFQKPAGRGSQPTWLSVLLAPVFMLAAVVAFIVALPFVLVVFLWSRYKMKKFMRTMHEQGEMYESQGEVIDSYTVEVETIDDDGRRLSDD